MKNVTIVCDDCGWELEDQKIEDWLDKECPACKKSIPVQQEDIVYFRLMIAIQKLSSIIKMLCPWIKTKTILVSSAELHKKNNANKP